ncbi:reverse transcriptase domain, reverse transcriptase zinc-binding domain protein [Tanacetum coccineum]
MILVQALPLDDLFLFAHGDANSAHVIMACLDEFKGVSGLVPSLPNSTTYFCNALKLAILNIISDCKELIDKVQSRIQDWKNKSLLAAGRAFLWCQGDMHKGKAKVAWEVVCLPRNEDSLDSMEWRHLDVTKPFNVSNVWESIRPRRDEISWCDVFWFSQCIPRHAFHLWLVIKRKLKTQDNLRQWDVSSNTNLNLFQCPLCISQSDFHDHLFFECIYSLQLDWSLRLLLTLSGKRGIIGFSRIRREDEERDGIYASMEVARFSLECYILMDFFYSCWLEDRSLLVLVVYGLHLECQLRFVLFFPSSGFFPLSFSWEAFLRRQDQLASSSLDARLLDSYGNLCSIRWFIPIGVLVIVSI